MPGAWCPHLPGARPAQGAFALTTALQAPQQPAQTCVLQELGLSAAARRPQEPWVQVQRSLQASMPSPARNAEIPQAGRDHGFGAHPLSPTGPGIGGSETVHTQPPWPPAAPPAAGTRTDTWGPGRGWPSPAWDGQSAQGTRVAGGGGRAGAVRPGHPSAGKRHSLEHGDEQVEQQNVGEEQVQAEEDDCQPLREDGPVPCGITLWALGLVGVSAIGAALVQVEVHA